MKSSGCSSSSSSSSSTTITTTTPTTATSTTSATSLNGCSKGGLPSLPLPLPTRTCAERKEYVCALDKLRDDSDEEQKPCLSRQVSVIQRTPFSLPAHCASPPSSPSKRKLSTSSACADDDAPAASVKSCVEDVDDAASSDEDGHPVAALSACQLESESRKAQMEDCAGRQPRVETALVAEPEQEAPIDYHIPKKPSSAEDDAKALAQRPKNFLRLAVRHRPQIYFGDRKCPKGVHILGAAAGHSRNSSGGNCNNGGQNGQGAGGNRGASGHDGYGGAGGGMNGYNGAYNGAGGLGGGVGGGAGGGGDRPTDGCHNGGCGAAANLVIPKCEFESAVSPLVALPPFEVTLKAGHYGGYHQGGCNNGDPYVSLANDHMGMEFDPSQDMHLSNLFPMNANDFLPKQLLLHNFCNIPMKEEEESSINGYLPYDDNLVSESMNPNSVDSLSFSPQFLDNLPDNGDYYVKQVSPFQYSPFFAAFPL